MIVGHIAARMGSVGVPRKNFRDLCGHPLVEWSLSQLLSNETVEHVFVSTDDPELHEFSIMKGARDLGLRATELSGNRVAKWDVWKDSVAKIEKLYGPITTFVDLDCTAPLRLEEDIISALQLFKTQKPDMVMSCCEAKKNPYFNLLEPEKNGTLRLSKRTAGILTARQNVPLVYEHAASTYVIDPDYIKSSQSLYEGRVIPYVMPAERCIDIDSELDFKIVEFLLKERLGL